MPKSFLKSQNPPDVPVEDWLTWSASTLETNIADPSKKIAGLMGINKAGDITHLIMPTIVTNAEIRPEEPLPSKFFRGTSWESATAELGLTRFPMVVPILFGMSTVEASIHDDDFEEKIGEMSPKHATWAKLIKEHFAQNENNEKCVDKIFDRVYKQGSRDKINAKYVTDRCLDGKIFEFSFMQSFTLPSGKWKESQSSLRSFFKGNPSPLRMPRAPSPVIPPVGVHFATTTTNQQVATATSPAQANTATTFDPMTFMKQFADQMMAVQQKSQTIVVESREDKTRETEAKFSNNMLQLLLLGGTVDLTSPGSFVDPRIAKYTQAMKNILL